MARSQKRAVLQVWVGDKNNPRLTNCLESPTDAEIIEQLKFLPGGDQISCVELHISKTHYIAVGGSEREGFYARYHEFSRAGEWETVRDDLLIESAAKLIANYRDQPGDWKARVEWKRRAMTSELQRARKEQEIRENVLWISKAAAFLLGLFGARPKRPRK